MIPWREGRHGSLATWLHAFRGGSATVAEANDNRRSKRPRVLRAADVIPPFDQDAAQVNPPENAGKEAAPEQSQVEPPKCERRGRRSPKAAADAGDMSPAESPAAAVEIPAFDLAENVLAEHRQMAARRRKAPGQTEFEIRPERPAAVTHVVEPPSQGLRELQHVVAEIVARDIQRLCSRPN